jgi:methionine sulfoxide reductase heme-binding subunit
MRSVNPLDYSWWLASRASGIVALLLVTVSVLIGLTMATKALGRPKLNRTLAAIHEHTALAGLIAISVHGLTLLGDQWLNPGPTGLLVPFTMSYRPLFTGLGIIAGYLAAFLGLTFYLRRRIGARLWRRMHRWTLAVYVLGVIHTLGAGTDASTPWMLWMLVLTGVPILFLTLLRFLPQRQRAAPRARTPSTPVSPGGAA